MPSPTTRPAAAPYREGLLRLAFILFALSMASCLWAVNYTWTGNTSTAWNVNNNWSPNTGFPGAADNATIVTAARLPLLDVNRTVTNLTMTSGTLNLNTRTLTYTGAGTFNGGAVNNGVLAPNSPAGTTRFNGTTFGANIDGSISVLQLYGGTFSGTVKLTKTGATGEVSTGTNIFNSTAEFVLTAGELFLAETGSTQFNGNLILNNTGTGRLWFGNSGGTITLATGRTVTVGASGFTGGSIQFKNFTQVGTTAQTLTVGTNAALNFGTGSTFNGAMTASGGIINLEGATFNSTSKFTKTGTTTDNGTGGCTFNGSAELVNANTGWFRLGFNTLDQFNGDLLVTSTSSGTIAFGEGTGGANLATGRTITVGPGGFSAGILRLRNFTQVGTTAQTLSMGTGASVYFLPGSTFNGAMTATCGSVHLNGSTFQGASVFTKTGAANNNCAGGCVFNGTVDLINTNTAYWYVNYTGTDQFNGNLQVASTSSGTIGLGQSTGSSTLASGRTISVGASGFATGILRLRNFTQLGTTASTLSLGTGAVLFLEYGSTFNAALTTSSGQIFLNGATFNGATSITKTGGTIDSSDGGNNFNATTDLVNTAGGNLFMANTFGDTFNGDLRVANTSTGEIRFGYWAASSTMAAGRSVSVGALGFASGYLGFYHFTQLGTATQVLTLGTNATVEFGQSSVFNGPVQASAGAVNLMVATFNGNCVFTKTGTLADGFTGGGTYNGTTELINTGTQWFRVNYAAADQYNGDLRVSSTSTGTISFGEGAGSATLASGKVLSVGTTGFATGALHLRDFTQLGTAAQNLAMGPAATAYFQPGNTFNGSLTTTSGGLYLNGTTFNGTSKFTKTGSTGDASSGGNVFNALAEFVMSGTGNLSLDQTGADQFNGDVLVNCTSSGLINFGSGTGSATLANGRTISVGASGFNSGTLGLKNFTQVGGTAQTLTLGTGATLYFKPGSVFNGPMTASAGFPFLDGSTFNAVSKFTKSGATNVNCIGGCTYNAVAEFIITGINSWNIAHLNVDVFNGNVLVGATANGTLGFGQGTANVTVTSGNAYGVGSTGFAIGTLRLRNVTQLGSAATTLPLNGATLYLESGNTFNGSMTATASGVFLNGSTFNAYAGFTKTGNSTSACTGGNVFNATAEFTNTSASGVLSMASSGTDAYNGNVLVSSNNTGKLHFGNGTGTSTLAVGRTLSVGALGFGSGELWFQNWTQLGSTPQSIALGGNGYMNFRPNSTWNGNVTSSAGNMYIMGTTFNGTAYLTKTGGIANTSTGGCTFNGDATIRNQGGSSMVLGNGTSDVFNAHAAFVRTGGGVLTIGNASHTIFRDNISTVGSTGQVQFGNGSYRTIIAGSNTQEFYADAAVTPIVVNLTMATTLGAPLDLYGSVRVNLDIAFNTGNIRSQAATSTSNGLLILGTACTVSAPAVNGSHVQGFVRKIGNSAFTFPTGDGTVVAPITMSAPANATDHFTAIYLHADPHPLYSRALHELSIHHVGLCEYWLLDRTGGTSSVSVRLHWDAPRSCAISDLDNLTVVRWDGAQWRNEGNGGYTGTSTAGTLVTSGAVASFSPFTFGSLTMSNPLPVELVRFTAEPEGEDVMTNWTTASERNSDHFVVERSADGETYAEVGRVAAAGTSLGLMEYGLVDASPLAGLSYYRLKQVDLDGTFDLSDRIAVMRSAGATGKLTVFPNPVIDDAEMLLEHVAEGSLAVMLLDVRGRVIAERSVVVEAGAARFVVPTGQLPPGVYLLRTTDGDGTVREARMLRQ